MQGLDGIFNTPVNLFLVRPNESSPLYKKISAVASACFYLLSYRSMTTARFATTVLSAVGINMLLRLLFESCSLEGGRSIALNTDRGGIGFSGIRWRGLAERLVPNTQGVARRPYQERFFTPGSVPLNMGRSDRVGRERDERGVLGGHHRRRSSSAARRASVPLNMDRDSVGGRRNEEGLVGHLGGRGGRRRRASSVSSSAGGVLQGTEGDEVGRRNGGLGGH